MFKRKSLAEQVRLQLLASAAILAPASMTNAYAAEESAEETEVIQVTGVRNSLKESAFLKKNAGQIMDAISAEDIGQLPDNNMAEALQRVTGIQIGRDDSGAGSGFQVRGLSQNRVEIDGQSMAGSGEDRSNNFSSVDSALFGGIEVIKSPMADMTEGAIGATVRLRTREPLSFKKTTVNINGSLTKDILADDKGGKLSILGATRFDLNEMGEIGVLVNVSKENKKNETHSFDSNWQLAVKEQIFGEEIFTDDDGDMLNMYRPQNLGLEQKRFEDDKLGTNVSIQWAVSDSLEFLLSANNSKRERYTTSDKMNINTSKVILTHDVKGSDVNDAPIILGAFSRPTFGNEFVEVCKDDNTGAFNDQGEPIGDGQYDPGCYIPATGNIDRYILQRGTIDSNGSEQTALNLISKKDVEVVSTYILKAKYFINDDLLMEAAWATSKGKTENEEFNLRFKPNRNGGLGYEDSSGEDLNTVVDNTSAFFDYKDGQDVPDFGVYAIRENFDEQDSVAIVQDALLSPELYSLESFNPSDRTFENTKSSLALDFDWTLDGDFATSLEFGARVAKNDINRLEYEPEVNNLQFNRHSIFSYPWRESDGDFTTKRVPLATGGAGYPGQRPDIAFIDDVMAESGYDSYLSNFLVTTDPFFPENQTGVNVPAWKTFDMSHQDMKNALALFFPGQEGTCRLKEIIDQTGCSKFTISSLSDPSYSEFSNTVDLPSGVASEFNEAYAYLISEETSAAYIKLNFESEVLDVPVIGNFGVRYVQTDTSSLGAERTTYSIGTIEVKDLDDESIEEINPITKSNSYTNVLPSGNINFMLQDNMFLRFAIAKTMSRPNPRDLSPSANIGPSASSARIGNSNLGAQLAWNYDASWEWYISDVDMISAAVYRKELSNFLESRVYTIPSPTDLDRNTRLDDVVVITQLNNGGDGTITGIELAATHTLDYLPGFLSGFGVQANYTRTESSQSSGFSDLDGSKLAVPDLSENNYNLIVFYDKYGFNFRAAYNYRDESYDGPASSSKDLNYFEPQNNSFYKETIYQPLGAFIPTWNDEFSTLDISMSYKYKGARIFLQATNVLNDVNRRYVGDKERTKMLTRSYLDTGTNYVFGMSYNF